MKVPIDCPSCGDSVGSLSESRRQAACDCGQQVELLAFALGPGCVFDGGYRIVEMMPDPADGFIAVQEGVARRVQIKILSTDQADEEELQRFQRQVKISASLQHAHIITAYHAGDDCGIRFLVMQYVEGESLARRVDRVGALPEKEAIELLMPIVEAMDYAWKAHQIIHRNIKPVNVIVVDGVPMLGDLAIAKTAETDASLTSAGFAIGTPEYMSPEQARGEESLDCRCDIYALGILLYELVTGRPPFMDSSPVLVLHRQLDEEPTPPRDKNEKISVACSDLILKLLQKDRNQRLPDWDTVLVELKRVLDGKPKSGGGGKASKGTGKSGKKFSSGNRRSAAAAAAVAPQSAPGGNYTWMYVVIGVIVVVIIAVVVLLG